MADRRHDAAFIVGAVLGGVAAGAYALFAAPQAGTETRAQLAERGEALAEQVAQATAELDGRVRGWLARVEERAAPLLGRPTATTLPGGGAPPGSVVETEPFVTVLDPLDPDLVPAAREPTADAGTGPGIGAPRPADHDR